MKKNKVIFLYILFSIFFANLFGYNSFVFIGSDRIFFVEKTGTNRVIFNFVNLSNFVKVIEASNIFLFKGGKVYTGQVFEDGNGFLASYLFKDWSSAGLYLWGKFNLSGSKDERFFVYREGKFFELEGVSDSEYDYLYFLVSQLDLSKKNVKMQYFKLGIPFKGETIFEEEDRGLLKKFKSCFLGGVNPPKIIKSPEIFCPDYIGERSCSKLKKEGILIGGIINTNGNISDVTILTPLNSFYIKDENRFKVFVISFIKLNFLFLPATKDGDIVNARVKFRVFFK